MLTRLEAARRDELVEHFAERIHSAGLDAPALFLLEWHRPLAFLGGQMLLSVQPFLNPFFGEANARELALFFEQEENVEQLIARLENRNP